MDYDGGKRNFRYKIFAFILTVFIIGMLVASGPADAFILGIESSRTNVLTGDNVVFTISADAETNEYSNINNLSFVLTGPNKVECRFYPNATIISGCRGMSIILTNKEEYGYGYGYGYGYDKSLSYNITLNTTTYTLGTYSTEIFVFADSKIFSKKGDNLTIYSSGGGGGQNLNINGCSIRAKDGKLYVNGSLFGINNKINLNMNFKNNGKGQGSLTSQYKKSRFSYSFKLEDGLLVNGSDSKINAFGYYRLNKVKFDNEDAVIYINKQNKKINIIGDDFEVIGMDITFNTKCKTLFS